MIKTFKSIRFKLVLWYFIVLTIILLTFGVLLYVSYRYSLYSRIDGSLQSRAEAVSGLIDLQQPELVLHFKVTDSSGSLNLDKIGVIQSNDNISPFIEQAKVYGQFIQIFDIKGNLLKKSSNLGNVKFYLNKEGLLETLKGKPFFQNIYLNNNISVRIITYPVKALDGKILYIIQVGTLLNELEESLEKLFFGLLVTVPATILLALLGGFIMAGKVLKPIEDINITANKINAENLSERLSIYHPDDEIGKLQKTLNKMFDRLENSFFIQKRFTADASHELRTPLTVLKGEIEITLNKDRTVDEYKEVLMSNLEEVDRLTKIVKDLLFLAKTDERKTELNIEKLHLDNLCKETMEHLELLAIQKKISMEQDIEAVEIMADKDKLKQLLLNILDNGIKYNKENGKLKLCLRQKNEKAEIKISDNGLGISQEDLNHIFERFYRVDKARSREMGGSGLGLSIVKWIIELHRGTIDVTSELNKGTTFTITLPLISL